MPQKCQVCAHPKTKQIEKQIVQGIAHTKIASQYEGLDNQNIRRHAINHLPEKLVKTVQEEDLVHSTDMLSTIQDLLDTSKDILDEALADDQKTTALSAIRESRNTIELMARIANQLEQYRREDEEKKEGKLNHQASQGLQSLTDAELNALIILIAKVHSNDPDYELDPATRYVVEHVNSGRFMSSNFDSMNQSGSSQSDSGRNSGGQAKNTKSTKDDEELLLDDLDLDLEDLELDDGSSIPSEETDPDWLKEERRRRRYGK